MEKTAKTLRQTPNEIRHQIWQELGRASQDRHHAWRTPVLASLCADGLVNARTVVLRAADGSASQLQIFTDTRSHKVAEIARESNAMFVFWSPKLNWQLRARVNISVLTAGSKVDTVWEHVRQSASASDYLSQSAPGSPLLPDTSALAVTVPKKSHFAVLNAQIIEMDWLELAGTGHRRAKVTAKTWECLTPSRIN